MVTAYNFIASWQLFPEKGMYEFGSRPKSGICIITNTQNNKGININTSWVTLENQAFAWQYEIPVDNETQPFADTDVADTVKVNFINSIQFETIFYKNGTVVLQIINELMPNGYLKITQKGFTKDSQPYINTEVYHKQMSVMPYASSAAGALIKPNEEGIIRHKALSAMEEQTHMQLDQIRKQIELLALQAQEIQMRKELSMIIYNAKLSFTPVIGSTYFLYQKKDDSHVVSMVGPKQWGNGPFKSFVAQVKLLADHTWVEV